jgi:phosphoglycolate phosphatase-like HAD superfamily hydrolase
MNKNSCPLAIAFDIDETLITTGGAGAKAWRRSFLALWNINADISLFTEVGMTDPVVAKTTFQGVMKRSPTPMELTTLLHSYLEFLPQEISMSGGYRVLPGVEELLPRLIKAGIMLGITSGTLEAAAHIKLDRAKLNHYFSFGGFGSDSDDRGELTRAAIRRAEVVRGEKINPTTVYVIGDTPKDIAAAHATQAIGIGVATGKYSVDELKNAGADYVLGSLLEPFPGLSF